jgi:putative addiction module component (TIGR02574 family)
VISIAAARKAMSQGVEGLSKRVTTHDAVITNIMESNGQMIEAPWIGACMDHAVPGLAQDKSGCSVRIMSESLKKFSLDKLDVEQRLALIEEIWDSIDAEEASATQLSDSQRTELLARLLEDDANPEDVVSWESIKGLAP